MGRLTVIAGAQYGSEAKGRVAAWYAAQDLGNGAKHWAVRVNGPNAGHSAVDHQGIRWPLRQIPVAAVTNPAARLVIAAGSEVDPPVLRREVQELDAAGYEVSSRLFIDRQVTIIEDRHKATETEMGANGNSTGKGIGAARAERALRRTLIAGQLDWEVNCLPGIPINDTHLMLHQALHDGGHVLVEGTQGYGLGAHAGGYPYTTSADCRAIDFLGCAGISPWAAGVDGLRIVLVVRPYPIRIAGDSGPLPGETSWEQLGLPAEHTTVTHKIRRVGQFDRELVEAAVRANGGPGPTVELAASMGDQLAPCVAGATNLQELVERLAAEPEQGQRLYDWIRELEARGTRVTSFGTGPASTVGFGPGGMAAGLTWSVAGTRGI